MSAHIDQQWIHLPIEMWAHLGRPDRVRVLTKGCDAFVRAWNRRGTYFTVRQFMHDHSCVGVHQAAVLHNVFSLGVWPAEIEWVFGVEMLRIRGCAQTEDEWTTVNNPRLWRHKWRKSYYRVRSRLCDSE